MSAGSKIYDRGTHHCLANFSGEAQVGCDIIE